LENVCILYQSSFVLFLVHGSPSPGPPVCIMQLAATLVKWVYSVKITQ